MRQVLYIFGDLEQSDITWLAENGDAHAPQSGSMLVEAGEPVAFLYVIMEGELEVVSPENKSIATLAAGDIIGEMSLIEKRLPEVSVRAGEQARVLAVPLERVRNKLESDQSFAARFYRALAVLLSDRLRSANRKLKTSDTPGNSQDRATQSYDPSELDEGIMDNLHVAGDRMRRLLALLEGRKV